MFRQRPYPLIGQTSLMHFSPEVKRARSLDYLTFGPCGPLRSGLGRVATVSSVLSLPRGGDLCSLCVLPVPERVRGSVLLGHGNHFLCYRINAV